MFRRITRAERERRAAKAELDSTMQAMRAVDSAFREAQDPFSIELTGPMRRQPSAC